ncbi:hypothetical protein CsSME_00010044 [Camellia sinensis var. sinensis]
MSFAKQIHILFFLWLATTATLTVGQGTRVGFYSTSLHRDCLECTSMTVLSKAVTPRSSSMVFRPRRQLHQTFF